MIASDLFPHHTTSHQIITSSLRIVSHHFISLHITSHHFTSHHITSQHFTLHHMGYHITGSHHHIITSQCTSLSANSYIIYVHILHT
eukprot:m.149874 g.149874  ORF g.149874 m.149874 type:complete len:87 (-) comp30688_c0_seq1:51-311(-)